MLDGGVLNVEQAFVAHAPSGPSSPAGLERAVGTVTIAGDGSQWNVLGDDTGFARLDLGIGTGGFASLNVQDAGSLNLTGSAFSFMRVGMEGGTGIASLDDASINLTPAAEGVSLLFVGGEGSVGSLSLNNGAVVSLDGNSTAPGGVAVGNSPGGAPGTVGILSLDNGSHLEASGAAAVMTVGFSSGVPTTGIVSVNNGSSIDIGNTIAVNAGGTMRVNDTSTVSAGNLFFVNGGLVGGTGTVQAPTINVANGGIWDIANSPGSMTVIGDMIFDNGGILSIEAAGLGFGEYDILNVLGDVTFNPGSSIVFDFLDGFLPGADFTIDFLRADSIFGLGAATFDFRGLPAGFNFSVEATGDGVRLARVPEPGTMALLVAGLAAFAAVRRRRRFAHA